MAPGNFKLNASSPLLLDILCDAIPQKKQQGKLLGYRILYRKEGSDTEKTVDVGPDILMHKITELKFASYSVRVAGFTRIGVEKFTVALKRFPREGSTLQNNLEFALVDHLSILHVVDVSW